MNKIEKCQQIIPRYTHDDCLTGMRKTIWINNPHEGPEEHEFEIAWIRFSDGITRAIYSSSTAPRDYWPRDVHIFDIFSSSYLRVGSYESRHDNNGALVYNFTSV
jgi:hypothetical protein